MILIFNLPFRKRRLQVKSKESNVYGLKRFTSKVINTSHVIWILGRPTEWGEVTKFGESTLEYKCTVFLSADCLIGRRWILPIIREINLLIITVEEKKINNQSNSIKESGTKIFDFFFFSKLVTLRTLIYFFVFKFGWNVITISTIIMRDNHYLSSWLQVPPFSCNTHTIES